MGQYYKPVNLKTKEWVYSHDHGNGLKLMEHSYLGNDFVAQVENLLAPGGAWHKSPIVWAGDYADNEPDVHGVPQGNLWDKVGDSDDENELKVPGKTQRDESLRFLVNHDKQVYIDLHALAAADPENGWIIHPLPLLTCEGNGRGGGDYRGSDERVGTWARDIISMEREAPEGYELVDGTFTE